MPETPPWEKYGSTAVVEAGPWQKYSGTPTESPLPGTERTGIPKVPIPSLEIPHPVSDSGAGIGPHLPGIVTSGIRKLVEAVPAFTNSPMRGTSNVIEGLGQVAAPLAIPAAISAPVATAGAMGLGYLGSKLGKLGTQFFGGSPEAQDLGGDIGGIIGGTAGGMAPAAVRGILPSTTRAGANFQKVMGVAKDIPIDLTKANQVAQRATELEQRGSSMPKVINDYIDLSTTPGAPITYGIGRDLSSAAGRMSAGDRLATNPQMQSQVSKLATAINEANADAAKQAGMLPEYNAAMKEYRSAMRMKAMGKTVGKAAIGATGLGLAWELANKYMGR